MFLVNDKIRIKISEPIKRIVYLRVSNSKSRETHVRSNNLFIPCLAREIPISKEGTANLRIGAVATNNVICIESLFSIGRFSGYTGTPAVLLNGDDVVRP